MCLCVLYDGGYLRSIAFLIKCPYYSNIKKGIFLISLFLVEGFRGGKNIYEYLRIKSICKKV